MSKQVKDQAAAPITQQQNKNLYVTVTVYDVKGKQIGVRVVDMYHYGTRNWLQNHFWWAMHNSHSVQVDTSTEMEIDEYMARQTAALQDKFGAPKNEPAPEPAKALEAVAA